MLTLTESEWERISGRIKKEYADKPSILMLSYVTERELGFTVRIHRTYTEQRGTNYTTYLDFYDDTMETFFRLKYLNRD